MLEVINLGMEDFAQNKTMGLNLSPTRGPFLLAETTMFSAAEMAKRCHKNVLVKHSHVRKNPSDLQNVPLRPSGS